MQEQDCLIHFVVLGLTSIASVNFYSHTNPFMPCDRKESDVTSADSRIKVMTDGIFVVLVGCKILKQERINATLQNVSF